MREYVHRVDEEESARIQRFLYVAAAGVVAFVVVIIIGIVTADRWLLLISHERERRFVEPYLAWADEHLLPEADRALQDYVEELGTRIAIDMDVEKEIELEFRVVDGSTVNAFTTLGGHIFVFEGLIDELDNENSLAMVLGHEIAHAKNRDPLLATGRGLLLQLMISSLSGNGRIDTSAADLSSDLMFNVYSRAQEENADRLALAALQKRYGHVGGATQLFRTLQESGSDPETIEILSSHPELDERVDYIERTAAKNGWNVQPVADYPPAVEALLSRSP